MKRGAARGFGAERLQELRGLGVDAHQVAELEIILPDIRTFIRRSATTAGTADLLGEIERLASDLSRKLHALATMSDAEHFKAGSHLERGYWSRRLSDSGPTVAAHMVPRLETIAAVAREARGALPSGKPTRHRIADPAPVRLISESLYRGWLKSSPSGAYPRSLQPSSSPGAPFRRIVGICYEAVGGTADPERAIKAFVGQVRKDRAELLAAIQAGIASAGR